MLNQQKDNYVISGICSKLAVKDTYHIVRQYNIPIPWFEHKSRNCFPFIWTANQRTVFYVIGTSVRKELNILGKYQLKATTKILKQAPWWILLFLFKTVNRYLFTTNLPGFGSFVIWLTLNKFFYCYWCQFE